MDERRRLDPGPDWVYTGSVFNGCDTWRAVVRAWITDDYGRRTYNAVSTTGAAFKDHCVF